MHSSKTLRRTRVPRPLTAESSEEFEEPSFSRLAHEDEQVSQKYIIQLDDKIERENNKCDKENEDLIESSQESTSTEGTSGSMGDDDEDRSRRNEKGATTPYCRKSEWPWRRYGQGGGDI